jgi:hypothetical protein
MTVPLTERFHRRVYWPPGSWHPPGLGNPVDEHPFAPVHPPEGISMCELNITSIHFQELIL